MGPTRSPAAAAGVGSGASWGFLCSEGRARSQVWDNEQVFEVLLTCPQDPLVLRDALCHLKKQPKEQKSSKTSVRCKGAKRTLETLTLTWPLLNRCPVH